MDKPTIPTIDTLHKLLRFDFKAGKMWWRERENPNFNSKYAGKEAFTAVNGNGYFGGGIYKYPLTAHRVIFAAYYGYWPKCIDHINRNRLDNRIGNLRDVPQSLNVKNATLSRANKSGAKGVHFDKRKNKWQAYIGGPSCRKHLGTFSIFEEAVAARKSAETELGYL